MRQQWEEESRFGRMIAGEGKKTMKEESLAGLVFAWDNGQES